MLEEIVTSIDRLFTPDNMIVALKIGAIMVIGFLLLRLILFLVKRTMKKRFSDQSIMIVRKLISYTVAFIILILVLKQLNVKLAAILGVPLVAVRPRRDAAIGDRARSRAQRVRQCRASGQGPATLLRRHGNPFR